MLYFLWEICTYIFLYIKIQPIIYACCSLFHWFNLPWYIVYCTTYFFSAFAMKCARCRHTVSSNDWVRRAGKDIYHLACFACMSCKRQLSTGEEFGLVDNQVLCRLHYDIMLLNLQSVSDNGKIVSLISWLQLLLADIMNT